MTIKDLNSRQIRQTKKFIYFDFFIKYRLGKLNSIDSLLKKLDYKIFKTKRANTILFILQNLL